ncbi:hypothetical protein ABEB36_007131 [Hypothenemus hampei]|uniref:Strictosidine synthase conserved region domain-containing protein n=1 Tax=Hypothenemus hampei TaxID=57062 RepID=A0ABD1EWV3_HYPHA
MGFVGIVKFFVRRLIEISLIATILVVIPNLPPQAQFSKPFTITSPRPYAGKLTLNKRLNKAEVWHKGDFVGAECFAGYNGELYTSLLNGDIVKLTGDSHITPVVKFGKPCRATYEERICGRPLGIQFSQNGQLFACDAYYGLYRVNIKTGEKVQLVNPKTEIAGKQTKLFNSLAVASNGDIYWTASSTQFHLEDGIYDFLADPSGRLIHYNVKTKENVVLIDNIHFANGVVLSKDEDFVIVSESARNRLLRYYLKGPKKGTHDVFLDGLPGVPDNLHSDGKDGYLVSLIYLIDKDHPALVQSMGPFPWLRKAIARFMGITEYLVRKVDQYYPNEVSQKVAYYIGHFTSTPKWFFPKLGGVLRVNKNGEITDSIFSDTFTTLSEAYVYGDKLYLGSPFNDYIARVSLSDVGWNDLKTDTHGKQSANGDTPKAAPKTSIPTTTTPKPTTTTPKPTTTTSKPTTTTPKPTTTTPKPTTTTSVPTTTTSKPTTTTPKTSTTAKPSTTTSKPSTTTPKPTTSLPASVPVDTTTTRKEAHSSPPASTQTSSTNEKRNVPQQK